MSWIEKILPRTKSPTKSNVPEGIWTKCGQCDAVLYKTELEKQLGVCPKCNHHMRVSARARLNQFLDQGERTELGIELEPKDLLKFKDSKKYKDRLVAAQKTTNEKNGQCNQAMANYYSICTQKRRTRYHLLGSTTQVFYFIYLSWLPE